MTPIVLQSVVDISGELGRVGGTPIQTDLGVLIGSFVGVIILVGAIAAFMYMVLGGIQWITAGGDTGKIEKARSKILQSVIGLAVLASTFAFFLVIQYFFGISILTTGGGSAGSTLGGGGGSSRSGGGSGVRCVIGETYNDGGAGGYCTGSGAARVKCVGPGEGPSGLQYVHYEPCECISGEPRPGVRFTSC